MRHAESPDHQGDVYSVKKYVFTPRVKVGALLMMAVLALVFILQNTQAVDTRLFFVTVNMPLAALLALTLLIGFTLGVLTALKAGRKREIKGDGKTKPITWRTT